MSATWQIPRDLQKLVAGRTIPENVPLRESSHTEPDQTSVWRTASSVARLQPLGSEQTGHRTLLGRKPPFGLL